jgi:hypothetical protein
VIGHSMGGGGVVYATEHRPALKGAVALAPFSPSQDMSTDTVPTMVMAGQNDTVVTPSYLSGLYATMPASTQSDFVQIAGADHVYYTHPNSVEMRLLIPWIKIFLDEDTRYTQFLCPALADPTGVSIYQSKCPYVPGGTTPPPLPGSLLHAVGASKCLDVPNSSTTGGTQLQIYGCNARADQLFTHTSSNQLTVYTGSSTQMCLDANAKGTTNGTKVIIWSCNGQSNQIFTRTSSGQLTVYSGASQLCLDASGQGTTNGTKVAVWTCNGQSNQQWNVNSNGTVTGVQSGLCLDVTGASTANGALVELWTCNGGSNQQWNFS